jgi:4-amino-4-deoxy-L-arabinose transferase-like glycosyltransferase
MYAAIGLAVLAKGPIGLLLPLTVFGCSTVLLSPAISVRNNGGTRWRQVWSWLGGQFSPRRVWHIARGVRIVWGIAIIAAVAGPWYLAVSLATDGQWLSGFIGTHNVHRFLHPMEGHSGSIFYYGVAVMAGFFPGSCFLPIAMVHSVRDQREQAPQAPSHAFLWSWILGYLVVFSLAATKLPNYVAPCYPALALLTGGWLVSALRVGAAQRLWLQLGMGSFALVGAVLTGGLVYFAMNYLDQDLLVALTGLAPLAGGIVALVLLQRGLTRTALISFATASVAFTILATSVTGPRVSPHQASPRMGRQLACLMVAFEGNSPRFATFRFTKPNVVYYLGRPAEHLESDEEAIDFLARDAKGLLVVPGDVYTRLRSQMPADSCVIHVEQQFMKPNEQVFIVGRQPQLALQPQPTLVK